MPFREAGALKVAPPKVPASERQASTPTVSRSLPRLLVWIAGVTAVCAVLVMVCFFFVDRPVATWIHQHLGDARFAWFRASYDGHPLPIGPFSFMAGPAQELGPLATVALVVLALAAAAGRRLKMRGRMAMILSLTVLAALQINSHVKGIFGRTWPESWLGNNPSWIRNGVFGFFPFHGGHGWDSFPSGHTTVITAPVTVLWIIWPELRGVWAALVAIVVAGLIGGNYHFVSDIIGGLYMGVLIGLGMAGLTLSSGDRLNWRVLRGLPPVPVPDPPDFGASKTLSEGE